MKNKITWKNFLILILIIVFVLGILYFLEKKQNLFFLKKIDEIVKLRTEQPIDTPNPWKIYRNENYGFEFGYPSYLGEIEEFSNDLFFEIYLKGSQVEPFLRYYPLDSNITFDNFIKKIIFSNSESTDIFEDIIIDKVKAKKISHIIPKEAFVEEKFYNDLIGFYIIPQEKNTYYVETIILESEKGGFFVINFAVYLYGDYNAIYGSTLFNKIILPSFKFLS